MFFTLINLIVVISVTDFELFTIFICIRLCRRRLPQFQTTVGQMVCGHCYKRAKSRGILFMPVCKFNFVIPAGSKIVYF